MQDQRLYQAGAALEAALSSKWGGNLITKAPALTGGK
jgi:aspartyl-tRNA(Asn)/glutamyl-tRNA(Gln) amidotransferase subunit A